MGLLNTCRVRGADECVIVAAPALPRADVGDVVAGVGPVAQVAHHAGQTVLVVGVDLDRRRGRRRGLSVRFLGRYSVVS